MVDIIGGGDRMQTGMTPEEAVTRAKRWWKKVGREYFRRTRDRKRDGIREDEELMANSGILSGKTWDELSKREKYHVIKVHQGELLRQQQGGN